MNATALEHIIDSLLVIVANSRRSGSAKVASEMCDKGYCSSKNMWYYGVKLHSLSQKQYRSLPKPAMFGLTPASVSDITFAKETLGDFRDSVDLHAIINENGYGINVFAPDGKEINFVDGLVENENEKDIDIDKRN